MCVTKPSCTQEKMIHFYVWNIERCGVVLCVIFVSYIIMTLICYISNELTPFLLGTHTIIAFFPLLVWYVVIITRESFTEDLILVWFDLARHYHHHQHHYRHHHQYHITNAPTKHAMPHSHIHYIHMLIYFLVY